MLHIIIKNNDVVNADILSTSAFSVPGKSQMSVQRIAKQFGVFYFNSIAGRC